MRDIIVYKCDVCDRTVELQRKPRSIETVGKCIITANCRGKLYVERLIKTTSPFIKRTEEVLGLDNFYPRTKFFKFTQKFEKLNWYINHNLESFPIISIYDDDSNIVPDSEFTVNIINKNTIEIVFNTLRSGTAELYVREVSVANQSQAAVTVEEPVQVSTNLLTGTMAVLTRLPRTVEEIVTDENGDPVFDEFGQPTTTTPADTVRFKLTSSTGQVQFSSAEINSVSGNSPWSGYKKIIIRNKSYYVGFVDFFSNDFNQSLISSGTSITIDSSDQNLTHFLLADSPFERVDILRNRILEVSKVNLSNGSLFFDNDEIFCDNDQITELYPNLITI